MSLASTVDFHRISGRTVHKLRRVNVDSGVLIGAGGVLLAAISIAYARSQALAQRRQVEEMQRQTEELRRAQHFEASHALIKDAITARQAWVKKFRLDWIPAFSSEVAQLLDKVDRDTETLFTVRMYVEQLQEMFFARKADMVADDHWKVMHRLMRGFFAPEIDRAIFDGFISLGWVTDEFARFGQEFVQTGIGRTRSGASLQSPIAMHRMSHRNGRGETQRCRRATRADRFPPALHRLCYSFRAPLPYGHA